MLFRQAATDSMICKSCRSTRVLPSLDCSAEAALFYGVNEKHWTRVPVSTSSQAITSPSLLLQTDDSVDKGKSRALYFSENDDEQEPSGVPQQTCVAEKMNVGCGVDDVYHHGSNFQLQGTSVTRILFYRIVKLLKQLIELLISSISIVLSIKKF